MRSSAIPFHTTFARSSRLSSISVQVVWSSSRLSPTTPSLVISPAAIWSISDSNWAVISGVAIAGTYFLNASYIAIPVSEGTGGLP